MPNERYAQKDCLSLEMKQLLLYDQVEIVEQVIILSIQEFYGKKKIKIENATYEARYLIIFHLKTTLRLTSYGFYKRTSSVLASLSGFDKLLFSSEQTLTVHYLFGPKMYRCGNSKNPLVRGCCLLLVCICIQFSGGRGERRRKQLS